MRILTKNRPHLFITLFPRSRAIKSTFHFQELTRGIYCQSAFFWEPGASMSQQRCFEEDCGSIIRYRDLDVGSKGGLQRPQNTVFHKYLAQELFQGKMSRGKNCSTSNFTLKKSLEKFSYS